MFELLMYLYLILPQRNTKSTISSQIRPSIADFVPQMNTTLEGIYLVEDFQGVGERIKQRLKELNLKQSDVCRMTGFSKTTLSNYINSNRLPHTPVLYELAKILKVSMEWLLSGEDPGCPGSQTSGPPANPLTQDDDLMSMINELSHDNQLRLEGFIKGMLTAQEGHKPGKT